MSIGIPNLHAASATLSWDANNESDLAGYTIYQRTLPSTEYGSPIFQGLPSNSAAPQTTVTGLKAGTSYGFFGIAFDSSGNESSASTEFILTTASDGGGPSGEDGFIAYNDLAWGPGQLTNKITTITSPKGKGASGLPSNGQLIDFTTGLPTQVSLKVSGGNLCKNCPNRAKTKQPKSGTDAHNLFNGIVSGQGAIQKMNKKKEKPIVLTFTGMDPTKRYDLAYFGHRNKFAWDQASLVTISGQKAFTNSSSSATDNPNEAGGALFTGPADTSTRLPADNDNGYVAQFSNIDPGNDGVVKLTISYDGSIPFKGKYGSAVRLEEK